MPGPPMLMTAEQIKDKGKDGEFLALVSNPSVWPLRAGAPAHRGSGLSASTDFQGPPGPPAVPAPCTGLDPHPRHDLLRLNCDSPLGSPP